MAQRDGPERATTGLFERMARRRGQRKGHLFARGGVWYLRYRVDSPDLDEQTGKPKRRRLTATLAAATGPQAVSKREAARLAWEEYLSKIDQAATRPGSMRTLQEFAKERFEPDVMAALKPTGRIFYRSILTRHVLPELGPMKLREIGVAQVQALLNRKLRQGLGTQTVTHIRNCISAVLRHAKAMQCYGGDLPTASVRLPPMKRRERRALSWEQVCELCRALPQPVATLVAFLALSGLRIGEAAGLRWEWVNLTHLPRLVGAEVLPPMCVGVRVSWVRGAYQGLKSEKASRNVPIPEWFAPRLAQLQGASGPADPVFAGKTGKPLDEHNVAARVLKPAARKLGMEWVSWHCLRHTNSTLASAAGLSVAERQRILGHATPEMNLHYTHAELEQIRTRWESAVDPSKLD
jgi:integrase